MKWHFVIFDSEDDSIYDSSENRRKLIMDGSHQREVAFQGYNTKGEAERWGRDAMTLLSLPSERYKMRAKSVINKLSPTYHPYTPPFKPRKIILETLDDIINSLPKRKK